MMPHIDRKYGLVFLLFLLLVQCRKEYAPPAITATNHFLVVDGVINIGAGSVTLINLNRTRNLTDSTPGGIPELGAKVAIVADNGSSYPLQDTSGKSGVYGSAPLTLDLSHKYKLAITTNDGRRYESDLLAARLSPVQDSTWYEEPGDLTFYVNTHDPSGGTRYYRWDYIETWEHDAQVQTPWAVKDHMIYVPDSTQQHQLCWTTRSSTDIILGSSFRLSQDVIHRQPVMVIPNGDPRINQKYSILIRQYALTLEAYNYWLQVQKTSEQLGTLFDLQPSMLKGNIHSLSDPDEPVIGYLSACSVDQKRLFLYQSELLNWIHNPPVYQCDSLEIPVNQTDYRIYVYPDTNFAPWYFVSSSGPLVLISRRCVDCTLFGGTTQRPSYWK